MQANPNKNFKRKHLGSPMYEIALVCINSPLYYGVYKDRNLIYEAKKEGKTLDALHAMQCELKAKHITPKAVYYARGPGNLSALKLAHTFLHTLEVVEGIELRACDSFDLLGEVAIFAFGKRYFIKRDNEIECVFLDEVLKPSEKSRQNASQNISVKKKDFGSSAGLGAVSSEVPKDLYSSVGGVVDSARDSGVDFGFAKMASVGSSADSAKVGGTKADSAKRVIFDSSFEFRFPRRLDISLFSSPCEPLYVLPPVTLPPA